MSADLADLADLLEDVEHVMLDFDGPVCSVFAGDPAAGVAQRLRDLAGSQGELPKALRLTDDPLDFLQLANDAGPLGRLLSEALRDAEVTAVGTARATPGATGVLTAAKRTDRSISIVSNNSHEAIEAYLTDHGLAQYFESVDGRAESDAEQTKTSPHRLIRALTSYASRHGITLEQARRTSVFIGDSLADVQAAGAADLVCVAYARNVWRQQLEDSDAAAVIYTMDELARALNARWDAQWCATHQGCC